MKARAWAPAPGTGLADPEHSDRRDVSPLRWQDAGATPTIGPAGP